MLVDLARFDVYDLIWIFVHIISMCGEAVVIGMCKNLNLTSLSS